MEKSGCRIAIVILNWNGSAFLRQFLPGVIQHSASLARIVVADNASSDDSIAYLESLGRQIEIIRLDKNFGFTGGYNRALAKVQAEYYVLLNSDVEVSEGWLSPLLHFMDHHPEAAACQPRIRSFRDRQLLEHAGGAGGYIDYLGYPFCRGRIINTLEEDKGQYNDTRPVFWATGACMFIRAADYHAQHGLDELFFAHMEEIDLCWRLQQSGKSVYVVPESVVYHVGGGTLPKNNPRKTYYNFRNNLLMLYKNLPGHRLLWLIPLRLILDGVAGIKFLADGDYRDTLAVIRAHFSFYRIALFKPGFRWNQQRKLKRHASKGIYRRSIVKAYYLKKQHFFSDLDPADFS